MPYQPLSDLTKVRAGEPVRGFAAKWYNDVVDMLTWWRRQQKSSGSGGASGPNRDGGLIDVRNDCGADRQTGEVLAIGDPIFSHSDNAADYEANNLLYSGTQPASDSTGQWCLLLEPIANGQIGTAAVAGEWPAQVNFTDASDAWAEVASGSYNLASGSAGSAQVISDDGANDSSSWTNDDAWDENAWSDPGVGQQWAIVRFPVGGTGASECVGLQIDDLVGVNAQGNSAGVSASDGATFQPYRILGDGSQVPDGPTQIAYPPPYLYTTDTVVAYSWGTYSQMNGKWVWIGGDCPISES